LSKQTTKGTDLQTKQFNEDGVFRGYDAAPLDIRLWTFRGNTLASS